MSYRDPPDHTEFIDEQYIEEQLVNVLLAARDTVSEPNQMILTVQTGRPPLS